ncbi:extracellular solute-binding protein [Pollutimonas bauzanensis]|uniref:ABC-type glycerol-3-phosphate transport system, substrate-binding protein n=1 Tax=Pollutimonas bauzanensis TaxID=658167 RepID=A0A1M5Z8Q8_9BURK|nr:extracellular solute-binding protein [Pollutimonas bauzanensis]SHI20617.1 ABC-type glycerol-3-phosphate transport system, substrate-binding protein [Pollutimonas bauzanensis]
MTTSSRSISIPRRSFLVAATAGAATLALGISPPAFAKKTKLVYWSPLDPKADNSRSKGEAAMIGIFRKQHPDIDLEVQPVPWQVMGQQLIQAVLAGTGPDVAQLSTTNLPDQVGAGSAAPLNDYVDKYLSEEQKNDFLLPRDNTVYDGQTMAYYWSTLLGNELWYLKDAVNGEPPMDWNELPAYLKAAGDKAGVPGFLIGLSQQGNGIGLTNPLIPALWACGADYVLPNGELGFANANGEKAFQWLVGMVRKHKVTPESIISLTRDNVLDAMKGRKTASVILSSNIVSSARASLGESMGLAKQPGPNGPCPAFATGKFLIMTKSCQEKEAAGLFIQSMISPESQLQNARIGSEIPVLKSVAGNPYFSTPEAADIKFALDYMASNPHPFKYPMRTDYLQTRIALATQQIFKGTPIKTALEQVAQDWNNNRKA